MWLDSNEHAVRTCGAAMLPEVPVKAPVRVVGPACQVGQRIIQGVQVKMMNHVAGRNGSVRLHPDDLGLLDPLSISLVSPRIVVSPGKAHFPTPTLLCEPGITPSLLTSAVAGGADLGACPETQGLITLDGADFSTAFRRASLACGTNAGANPSPMLGREWLISDGGAVCTVGRVPSTLALDAVLVAWLELSHILLYPLETKT